MRVCPVGVQEVLGDHGKKLVIVGKLEGPRHLLPPLSPSDAARTGPVVPDDRGEVSTPAPRGLVRPAVQHHVPRPADLVLGRDRQGDCRVKASEEVDRRLDLDQVLRVHLGPPGDLVAGDPVRLPVVQDGDRVEARVGLGVPGLG